MKIDISKARSIAVKMKLPDLVVIRLYNLLTFVHMEGQATNPGIHDAYRLKIKRQLYIKCLKQYPDLFKGKQSELERKYAGEDAAPEVTSYVWNSSIEGDELCEVTLKSLAQS